MTNRQLFGMLIAVVVVLVVGTGAKLYLDSRLAEQSLLAEKQLAEAQARSQEVADARVRTAEARAAEEKAKSESQAKDAEARTRAATAKAKEADVQATRRERRANAVQASTKVLDDPETRPEREQPAQNQEPTADSDNQQEKRTRALLAKLQNETIAGSLFLSESGKKGAAMRVNDGATAAEAAAFHRAFGQAKWLHYNEPPSSPRERLAYLEAKRTKIRAIVEAYLTGNWPIGTTSIDAGPMRMLKAVRLTELVLAARNLPEFDFGTISPKDQKEIIDVLRLFGSIRVFEGLPYEAVGDELANEFSGQLQ